MQISSRRLLVAIFLVVIVTAPTAGASTSFSVLSYNVAGLPTNPTAGTNMPMIAGKLNSASYDFVGIQEVFVEDYHTELKNNSVGYPAGNTTPYHPVPAPPTFPTDPQVGSGLMRLSNSTHTNFTQTQWASCNGFFDQKNDCLATKGYSWARHSVGGGNLDIYNYHADAGTSAADFAARAANTTQLANFVASNSTGNAVIILGDTNSFYTRGDGTGLQDNIATLLSITSVKDAWLETFYGGTAPGLEKDDCTTPDSADCELRDKVFFRSGNDLLLSLSSYDIPLNFMDGASAPLSDHLPVKATFDITVVPEPSTALQLFIGLTILGFQGRSRRR
jgi:endonuclease/exonuclease/phosphatase family metal-dependent hydrolase